MNAKSIIGAIGGGVVGALVWAAILHFANYEVGLVAWAVGGLVGFASASLGGSGFSNGGVCALVTVLSIFAGKAIGIDSHHYGKNSLHRPVYEELKEIARPFAALDSEEQHAQFMIDNGYTEARSPAGISPQDRAMFEAQVEQARKLNDGQTFKQWVKSALPIGLVIKEAFGLLDILFLFLGVATAFKIGAGLGEETA